MTYAVFEDEHYYICHDGRELRHIRTESKDRTAIPRRWKYTDVQTAAAVSINPDVFYRYNAGKNPDRNKVMRSTNGGKRCGRNPMRISRVKKGS